jgi:hypothetical protein
MVIHFEFNYVRIDINLYQRLHYQLTFIKFKNNYF